jgi:hypothetical protein
MPFRRLPGEGKISNWDPLFSFVLLDNLADIERIHFVRLHAYSHAATLNYAGFIVAYSTSADRLSLPKKCNRSV